MDTRLVKFWKMIVPAYRPGEEKTTRRRGVKK
jgi:hypothetical protein